MNLKDLIAEIPHQWRVQSVKEYGADCVAYIDSRDVQRRLDEVCGPENWQDDYFEIGGKVFCKIGILCGGHWVWKSDCGTESNVEKEKGQASDAFKRAAVKWGIGRFLYDMKIVRLKAKQHTNNKYYPADDSGNILWNPEQISAICESKQKGNTPPPKPTSARQVNRKAKADFYKLTDENPIDAATRNVLGDIYDSVKDIAPDRYEVAVEAFKLFDNKWPTAEKAGWVIDQLKSLFTKGAAA